MVPSEYKCITFIENNINLTVRNGKMGTNFILSPPRDPVLLSEEELRLPESFESNLGHREPKSSQALLGQQRAMLVRTVDNPSYLPAAKGAL